MVDSITFRKRTKLVIKIKAGHKVIGRTTTTMNGVLTYDFPGAGSYDFICITYPEYSMYNHRVGKTKMIGSHVSIGVIPPTPID